VVTGESNQVFLTCQPLATLSVRLIDNVTKKPIANVKFQIETKDHHVIGTYKTDTNGEFTVPHLMEGDYIVSPVEIPESYHEIDTKEIHINYGKTNHLDFTASPYGRISVTVIDKKTKVEVSEVKMDIFEGNGKYIGMFVTDGQGNVLTEVIPNGKYTVKLIQVPEGYTIDEEIKEVEIKDGQTVLIKFEIVPEASITVISRDQNKMSISGMKFTVTKFNGEVIGTYETGVDGKWTVTGLKAGDYIVKEDEAPQEYLIKTETQKAILDEGEDVTVIFDHDKRSGIEIRSKSTHDGANIEYVTYEVTKLDGSKIGTYTSNTFGICYLPVDPGTYIVKPVKCPDCWKIVSTEGRNVTVSANKTTEETYYYIPLSSMSLKITDGTTKTGVYGVVVSVKDSSGNVVGEYRTSSEGVITLENKLETGKYDLTMISVPDSYTVDEIPKTIETNPLKTTTVSWKIYPDSGQIQVVVTSKDYNEVRNLKKGTRLQGAVFEITNADTYEVVGQMISDSKGIAASDPLPLGRYTIRQTAASPYYKINTKTEEVRLKIKDDTVQVKWTENSITMDTSLQMCTNKSVESGVSFRVDVTEFQNNSSVGLENYYLHVKIPTDATRISTFATGKYNKKAFYKIQYKTNMRDYKIYAKNLSSKSNHSYDFSSTALKLQSGEYVTDIMMIFDKVPVGFKAKRGPQYMLYCLSTATDEYKIIHRMEMGGAYREVLNTTNGNIGSDIQSFSGTSIDTSSEAWETATCQWVTVVDNTYAHNTYTYTTYTSKSIPSKLPKTGY